MNCLNGWRRKLIIHALCRAARRRGALLKKFRSTPNAVLFATASFWQGVDVRGEQLSCVIIDKLPFAVPSDPVVAARQRYIEEQGGSSFYEYSVPQAIISLKQGLGRLIRSTTDRGVLAVLDPRLRTKMYGQTFLQSLPPCRVTSEIDELARVFELGLFRFNQATGSDCGSYFKRKGARYAEEAKRFSSCVTLRSTLYALAL